MRQNNILGGYLLIPVHADKPVVVQGFQGIHKVSHRKLAIPQKHILTALTVADTDIADISAQGLDGGIRILFAPEIGFPDIPAHTQCGAAKQIDDIQRTLCMGKVSHGFQQDGNTQPLSAADRRAQKRSQKSVRRKISELEDYLLHTAHGCLIHIPGDHFRVCDLRNQLRHSQCRNFNMAVDQLSPGASCIGTCEDTVGVLFPLICNIINFKTGKTILCRFIAQLQKGIGSYISG